MQNFFTDYGLFLLEVITIALAILLLLSAIIAISAKGKMKPKEKITIRKLNDKYEEMKHAIEKSTLNKKELKALVKKRRQEEKSAAKMLKKEKSKEKDKELNKTSKRRLFVLNFAGDIRASAVENFREEVTAVLTAVTPNDEVLVRLESAGGMVHGYGLAASQLQRIRARKIPLTIAVDKVAASGGYMMACVADKILAAPFAIIGSIGVLAQLPNFNRFLKKRDISFEQVTAGEYKRTLSLFGENTSKGRKKMQEEVEEAHKLFKRFIAANRAQVAIEKISTGEHWYGTRALELKLIDELLTSDDYLLRVSEKANIFEVTYTIRKTLAERCLFFIQNGLEKSGLYSTL